MYFIAVLEARNTQLVSLGYSQGGSGDVPSGKAGSILSLFQLLWLLASLGLQSQHSNFCLPGHTAFSSCASNNTLPCSSKGTCDYIQVHPDNPEKLSRLRILTKIIPAKSPLPRKVALTNSRNQDEDIFGGHHSVYHIPQTNYFS